jgi:hypothetical protein
MTVKKVSSQLFKPEISAVYSTIFQINLQLTLQDTAWESTETGPITHFWHSDIFFLTGLRYFLWALLIMLPCTLYVWVCKASTTSGATEFRDKPVCPFLPVLHCPKSADHLADQTLPNILGCCTPQLACSINQAKIDATVVCHKSEAGQKTDAHRLPLIQA